MLSTLSKCPPPLKASRTDAGVDDPLPDAALEEAGAAVAAVHAVVLPVRLVAAHLAQHGHGQRAPCNKPCLSAYPDKAVPARVVI